LRIVPIATLDDPAPDFAEFEQSWNRHVHLSMVAKAPKRSVMATGADYWLVRMPDGRILRSRSTESLRQHIRAGRIPWESRVRRSSDDPWQTLDNTPAFADLAPSGLDEDDVETRPDGPSPRKKARAAATEMRTLGVRGLLEELFNAFDISLQKAKLTTTALSGLLMGIAIVFGATASHLLPFGWKWAAYPGTALALCVIFSTCTSILTQLTALELSRYRPAHFREVRAGLFGSIVRLTCAFTLIGGSIGGLIFFFHSLPTWLTPVDANDMEVWQEMLLNVVSGGSLLLEVICWPILGFAMLLLGPILIVEECSVLRAILAWVGILRQHLGRIYLYQALAFASAGVLTLPLLAPIWLAFGFVRGNPLALSVGEAIPFFLLVGVAITPTLSYLLVAHVFIYLNLRYEFFYSARER
jgi:hypothetical protein